MPKQALEYPWPFRVLRKLFPLFEKIGPRQAQRFAVRLFLTPIGFPFKEEDLQAMETFDKSELQLGAHRVIVYKKGSGPEVICLHGWSGRAMQFKHMADRLVEAGFTCVLLDAPGHGKSSGGQVTMFDFRDAFTSVFNSLEMPIAAVGHSLGAASISLAVHDGLRIPALASFGAPVIGEDILSEFRKRINASDRVTDYLQVAAKERYQRSFASVTMEYTFPSVQCPVFGVHGEQDHDVPPHHLARLKEIQPDMETHFFERLGHRRILKEDEAITRLIDWLKRLPLKAGS